MKAAYIKRYGQERTIIGQLPKPSLTKPTQVLVKVLAASVNPVDLKIQKGELKPLLQFSFPLILGNDYVGIVEEVGCDVKSIQVGQRVFGRISKQNLSMRVPVA